MPAGLSSGTASTTLFSTKSMRVSEYTKSAPFSFCPASRSFIWDWPAEMNRSHTAPSMIWVRRVPEDSKEKVRVTSGATSLYRSAISVRVASRDAAANTTTSTGSAWGAVISAAGVVLLAAGVSAVPAFPPPQAARDRVRARRRDRAAIRLMVHSPLQNGRRARFQTHPGPPP